MPKSLLAVAVLVLAACGGTAGEDAYEEAEPAPPVSEAAPAAPDTAAVPDTAVAPDTTDSM
jgi:hypothetical protein